MAGVSTWPDYMHNYHAFWLANANAITAGAEAETRDSGYSWYMDSDIGIARTNNPYVGESGYNPDTDLDNIESQFSDFQKEVESLSHIDDWGKAFAEAVSLLAEQIPQVAEVEDVDVDEEVDAAADAYERRRTPAFMRTIGRLAAGLNDVNAVHGSAFFSALASVENEFQGDIGAHRSEMRTQAERARMEHKSRRLLQGQQLNTQADVARNNAVLSATTEMLKMLSALTGMKGELVRLRADTSKMAVVARKEHVDQTLAIKTKEATWELDLYAYAGNLLASISGGVQKTPDAGWMADVLGGLSIANLAVDTIGDVVDIFSGK